MVKRWVKLVWRRSRYLPILALPEESALSSQALSTSSPEVSLPATAGSRPTRWMYENLRSFFSVLMSPTTALMRIRAPSLRQPRSRNEKTVTATQIWRRRFHVPADDLMYEVGRRCLGSFGIVMMSVPKFGRWVWCRRIESTDRRCDRT